VDGVCNGELDVEEHGGYDDGWVMCRVFNRWDKYCWIVFSLI